MAVYFPVVAFSRIWWLHPDLGWCQPQSAFNLWVFSLRVFFQVELLGHVPYNHTTPNSTRVGCDHSTNWRNWEPCFFLFVLGLAFKGKRLTCDVKDGHELLSAKDINLRYDGCFQEGLPSYKQTWKWILKTHTSRIFPSKWTFPIAMCTLPNNDPQLQDTPWQLLRCMLGHRTAMLNCKICPQPTRTFRCESGSFSQGKSARKTAQDACEHIPHRAYIMDLRTVRPTISANLV